MALESRSIGAALETEGRTLPASAPDDPPLIRALVRAFRDDPLLTWVLRPGGAQERALALYFRTCLELYRPHPAVLTISSRQACAIWAPPGTWHVSLGRQLLLAPRILGMLGLGRLARGLSAMQRMEREHPSERHHYLHLLGVDPDCQGRGHGSALVQAGLARVDVEQAGAYLETANERNLPLYLRHGFEVRGTYDFGPGTPTCWRLWRPPRR